MVAVTRMHVFTLTFARSHLPSHTTTMFSSLFSGPTDPKAQNFHPVVTAQTPPSELFSKLEAKDLEWTCAGGFVTETQTWYNFLEDGTLLWCQIIHSAVGLWYPQIQFTCRIFDPATKETTWKSINITGFVTPPPGKDKRSAKSDQFTVTHGQGTGEFAEQYTINANLGNDLQLGLTGAGGAGCCAGQGGADGGCGDAGCAQGAGAKGGCLGGDSGCVEDGGELCGWHQAVYVSVVESRYAFVDGSRVAHPRGVQDCQRDSLQRGHFYFRVGLIICIIV
ncbi:hypothetical protein RSAG8_01939, partial [Rhizoctonia solani AG-8 WAC10335]